jgi:ribosomal protein S18 acetylase RimI-like enzyme
MLKTREVRLSDLDVIATHRCKMFEDMGANGATLETMAHNFASWVGPRLADGRYLGFLVEDENAVVAGIGVMLLDWPPHILHPESSQRGYILNLYVEPEYRGRGIATDLTRLAEACLADRGIRYAILHASPKGRPLYEKLGWASTSEMAKTLSKS